MADSGMGKLLTLGGVAVAAYFVYEWLFPTPAASTTTASSPATSTTTTGTAAAGGATSTAAQTTTIASVYSLLLAKVTNSNDPAVQTVGGVPSATPDVFNFYLAQVFTPTGSSPDGWPPNVLQVFPGVDRTQAMSITTYWAGISSYLSASMGMSGLGVFAGLAGLAAMSRGGMGMYEQVSNQYPGWPEVAGSMWGGGGRAVQ